MSAIQRWSRPPVAKATKSLPEAVVGVVYDAFRRGDLDSILDHVAPDAVVWQGAKMPWGGEFRGPEGAAELLRELDAEMETISFDPRVNVKRGDEVLSCGWYTGRSRTTGRTSRIEWMLRWRVEDGLIAACEPFLHARALAATA